MNQSIKNAFFYFVIVGKFQKYFLRPEVSTTPGSGCFEGLVQDLQKVPKFLQMGIFEIRNICKKRVNFKLQLITTKMPFLGNQTKYYPFVVESVEKLLHSSKVFIKL